MLYFREEELKKLNAFINSSKKSLAIYGRRRTGKTQLILEAIKNFSERAVYFQCASYDYNVCLDDFSTVVSNFLKGDPIVQSLKSFRDIFSYLSSIQTGIKLIVIDEFPFLAKKDENTAAEFQWIIDHGLGDIKLILLGSNLSFMRKQINDREAPLYGRFDEVMQIIPFTFDQIHELFANYDDAVNVYAQTGGVAQYVMFYKNYPSVKEAECDLFFNRNGRLFQEANNTLMQELREITTYSTILRAIGSGEKDSGQIASKCAMDQRAVYAYLNKLTELEIIAQVDNPLSDKKKEKKYKISDLLFRFNYTFIEPNASMIASIGEKASEYILGSAYSEYLGLVFEEIIRSNCYKLALEKVIPFMPVNVGKWWGNIYENGKWSESEIDLIAYNNDDILLGECKFRNKKTGIQELERLKLKAQYVPVKNRKVHYLLASKQGFTEDLLNRNDVILLTENKDN